MICRGQMPYSVFGLALLLACARPPSQAPVTKPGFHDVAKSQAPLAGCWRITTTPDPAFVDSVVLMRLDTMVLWADSGGSAGLRAEVLAGLEQTDRAARWSPLPEDSVQVMAAYAIGWHFAVRGSRLEGSTVRYDHVVEAVDDGVRVVGAAHGVRMGCPASSNHAMDAA